MTRIAPSTADLQAFKSEGFFVHVVNHDQRLYQLRKEDAVISFQHQVMDIVFKCEERLTRFVTTAMVEVVAELERHERLRGRSRRLDPRYRG